MITSVAALKASFENGDIPLGTDFENIFDSYFHKSERVVKIEEYASLANFPNPGVINIFYIALDTNFVYYWSESLVSYICIGEGNKIFKGTTDDGSTNIIEFYNLSDVLVQRIDTNGFEEIRYRDEYPSGIWQNAAGAAAPTTAPFTIGGVGCNRLTFNGATTEEKISNSFEIAHDIDFESVNAGTKFIEVHIHWSPSTTATGIVQWFFDYCYRPVNAAPIVCTSLSVSETIASNKQYFQIISAFKDGGGVARIPIPAGGFTLGDMILFNLRRTPSGAGDTYPDDAILEQVALHIPCNSHGSRQIYVK